METQHASGSTAGTTVTTLPNGLTIIVREDHSAPVVSAQAWCMAGSVHEGEHLGAGLSHVLEHMLFKGTTTRPGSRIDQEVQEAGGYMNAYTSLDRTVFHIDVPSSGTHVALDVLCDVMQHATLPAEDLEKEKQVILREMDMNMDDPGRRASRRLFETAFTRSPYRFTVIGYPDLFHEITRENLHQYYHQKYAPNNVFYVVAGDVEPTTAVEQIRAAYNGSKARFLGAEMLPAEPRQTSPREICEEAAIELGYLHMAWHIPDTRHPDMPVLDVLAVLLGHGRSSRLYEDVRQKLALVHSADAWTYSPGNEGLFGVSATLDGDKFTSARDALLEQVHRLTQEEVAEKELRKAVRQFTAAYLSVRKTMQGQAQDMGSNWLQANDLCFSERYLAAIQGITRADLKRVASTYLSPENRTIYCLLPHGCATKPIRAQAATTGNPVSKVLLPNGLRLLLKEDRRLPFVEIRCAFRGGVLAETAQNNGISQLMSRMLIKGTAQKSAEELAQEIESTGGSIETYSGNNSLGVNMEVLREDIALGLAMLKDVLISSVFPEKAMERERDVQLASILAQKDLLLHEAFSAMRRKLFSAKGYGLDPLGSEETLKNLTRDGLLAFYKQQVSPKNCVLAIYGDVDASAVSREVEEMLKDWSGPAPVPPSSSGRTEFSSGTISDTREKQQAVVVIGYPGVDVFNKDRYALELIQEVCSDLGSRLFMRVRDTLGLAYYVGAQSSVGLTPGYFAFYAGTSLEHAARVQEELVAETLALRSSGLTDEELRRSKAKIIGQRKISRQELGALAMTQALDELYGLGFENVEKEDAAYESVTKEHVIEVARRYLLAEASVVSTILPNKTGAA